MLKIKDNVDLKELEKYGFEYKKDKDILSLDYYNLGKDELGADNRVVVIKKDRTMEVDIDTDLQGYSEELEVLYDLIQDGLVDKINGEDKPQYLGYSDKECINCGRLRVERYSDGTEICEKCNFDQNKKEYVLEGENNDSK